MSEFEMNSTASEEMTKDAYAFFGRAYYFSECLHRELCNRYALAAFQDASDVTLPRVEERLKYAFSLTMGPLVEQLVPMLPPMLGVKLRETVAMRNFLAHHFWYERIHLMVSDDGLLAMINELEQMADLFDEADREVQEFFVNQLENFGVTTEVLHQALRGVLAGNSEPLPQKRFPRKRETIVHVWDVPTGEGSSTLVFEGDDGEFWQLCESGLGWTYQDRTEAWTENAVLQPFMPAVLSTRPKCSAPWSFEIDLTAGHELWVQKSQKPHQYRWGVRKRSKDGS